MDYSHLRFLALQLLYKGLMQNMISMGVFLKRFREYTLEQFL